MAFQVLFTKRSGTVRGRRPNQELNVLQNINSCLSCRNFFFIYSSEKKVYLVMQVSSAGNQEIELGRSFCQEHVLAELQIIFLRFLPYVPSVTLCFSLVLVSLSPAIPLVHETFYKTRHLFTMNSNRK